MTTNDNNTVALTRISPIGTLPQYTTNEGRIGIMQDVDGTWAVGPMGGARPFASAIPDFNAAIEFVIGAREMFAS